MSYSIIKKLEGAVTVGINYTAKAYNDWLREQDRVIAKQQHQRNSVPLSTSENDFVFCEVVKQDQSAENPVSVKTEKFTALEKSIGVLENTRVQFLVVAEKINGVAANLAEIVKALEERQNELEVEQGNKKKVNEEIHQSLLKIDQELQEQLSSSTLAPYLETTNKSQAEKTAKVKSIEAIISYLKTEIELLKEKHDSKINELKKLRADLDKIKETQENLQKELDKDIAQTLQTLGMIDSVTGEAKS